jgi:hypothetical protein
LSSWGSLSSIFILDPNIREFIYRLSLKL